MNDEMDGVMAYLDSIGVKPNKIVFQQQFTLGGREVEISVVKRHDDSAVDIQILELLDDSFNALSYVTVDAEQVVLRQTY